jgi:Reverse transcriptase-like
MVINQLERQARAKRGAYITHHNIAKQLRDRLPDTHLVWIPRSTNKQAHSLCRKAITPFVR